jgi:hypothetical protein
VFDPFALGDASENVRHLVDAIWSRQDENGVANHFRRRIAKDALGGLVPARDSAVQVFGDVIGILDNRSEKFDRRGRVGARRTHRHL